MIEHISPEDETEVSSRSEVIREAVRKFLGDSV
ncbi:MAG: ribbon-helix-helix protein, CopG family [Thaumarchaeota archaeon]|nr:ribbon-helix-helix protein, CopG family [Nitrososphaerota archaeon]